MNTKDPEYFQNIQEQLKAIIAKAEVCTEMFYDGPSNKEWLLDFNLPELYVRILNFYAFIGELDLLHRHTQHELKVDG